METESSPDVSTYNGEFSVCQEECGVRRRERTLAMTEMTSDQPASHRHKRRDAVENQERILQAARHLFATQGVEATSMNEIAQVAQVGPGTLYRSFAHKSALGQALLAEEITGFLEAG